MFAAMFANSARVQTGRLRADIGLRAIQLTAIGLVGIILIAIAVLTFHRHAGTVPEIAGSSRTPHIATEMRRGLATMPSAPINGKLVTTIPPGAAADQHSGGRGYVMPSVISLRVGEMIVIRNDDDSAHMILFAFVAPGETVERIFTDPGSEVYSSGCGLHGAAFLNFTTIFVSDGPGVGRPALARRSGYLIRNE